MSETAPSPAQPDRPDQLARIRAVREACVAAGEADPLDEAASLRLDHRGLDGVVAEVDVAGFALLRDGELDLAVRPDRRGAGTGAALLGAVLARGGDGALTAWSHQDHPAARRLAASTGFASVRELWVMRRAASEPLPALQVPDDVRVRGFRDADRDAVLDVNASAFAGHPEQGSLDVAGFAERTAEPWWDPAGLLVAVERDDDQAVLGFHWTKQHSPRLGEVYVVGVGPAAQGRGLGRVLTLAGLHHLHGLGVAEVQLYVESDNEPAVHVYSRLGFTHRADDTHVQYRRPAGGSTPR